ncbi:unnamed protein product [Brassica rapa subsp. trilocularis]
MVSEPYTFFSENFEIDHVKPEPDHDYWGTAGTTEVRRTISPYDLTSADKPGVVISHPFLKETNYDEWAYGMKTALTSRKKFGFLTGPSRSRLMILQILKTGGLSRDYLCLGLKITIDPILRSNISHRDVLI